MTRTNQDPTRRPRTVHPQGLLSSCRFLWPREHGYAQKNDRTRPVPSSTILFSCRRSVQLTIDAFFTLSWEFTLSGIEQIDVISISKLALDYRCPSSRVRWAVRDIYSWCWIRYRNAHTVRGGGSAIRLFCDTIGVCVHTIPVLFFPKKRAVIYQRKMILD